MTIYTILGSGTIHGGFSLLCTGTIPKHLSY